MCWRIDPRKSVAGSSWGTRPPPLPNLGVGLKSALETGGVPHAHVTFPGEQHGFRRAENIRTALEGELYFYGRIFGFEVDVLPAGIEIVE